jgi:Cyclophilin-like family
MAAGRYRHFADEDDDHTREGQLPMRLLQIAFAALAFLWIDHAMAQERIRISSNWGNVTAELADNAAARSLIQMLPITVDCAITCVRKRQAICHHRCRKSPGSEISQQERLDFGGPTTLLSITAAAAFPSRALSF